MLEETHVELWISRVLSVFCVSFLWFGAPKFDENGVPGPIRDQVSIETPKKSRKVRKRVWILIGGETFGGTFWRLSATFLQVVL